MKRNLTIRKETSMDEIKGQFETNFFGAVRVMQAVMPMMRKQGGGIIVNITSLGGRISFPLNSPYHATKFALEGLSVQKMGYPVMGLLH
jgi:short-subunit dehydrogenase